MDKTEKTLDQKIKECKTVYIQNIEKTMQTNMVYKYLKDQRIDQDVKKYTVNSKDGFITLEFSDHEKAKSYYDKANFKHKILVRPFNIYFNLQLSDNEMKKYYFEGLAEENLRKMFQIARNSGVCKIYTSYTATTSKGKLKPTGVLSFIRNEQISEKQFMGLKEELQKINVKIYPYVSDKGLKCSVYISNFYNAGPEQEESEIEKKGVEKINQMTNNMIKNKDDMQSVTVTVKRKETPDPQNNEKPKVSTSVKALIEFKTFDLTIKNFEQIRLGFLKESDAKAILNFHNAENNSFVSLFTSGLKKPESLSEKQFENKLVESFKRVNSEVLQVLIFPVEYNKTYVARVYLKNEEAGKSFIVDYTTKRQFLFEHYKDKENIRFNINVDDKTMKKIKAMEKRATQIVRKIKNQEEAEKRSRKPMNQFPINDFGPRPVPMSNKMPMNPNIPTMGGMMPNMPNMPNMQNMPNMPNMSNMPNMPNIPPNMGNIPPNMPMGNMPNMQMPTMGNVPKNAGNEQATKITKIIRDRNIYESQVQKDPGSVKNLKSTFVQPMRFVLETKLRVPPSESGVLVDKILSENDIKTLIDFFEAPEEKMNQVNRN